MRMLQPESIPESAMIIEHLSYDPALLSLSIEAVSTSDFPFYRHFGPRVQFLPTDLFHLLQTGISYMTVFLYWLAFADQTGSMPTGSPWTGNTL